MRGEAATKEPNNGLDETRNGLPLSDRVPSGGDGSKRRYEPLMAFIERNPTDRPEGLPLLKVDAGEPHQAVYGSLDTDDVSQRERNEEIPTPEDVTFAYEADAHGRAKAKFFKNGKEVGSADIRIFPQSIQITNFQIARGNRRKGIGTAFQFYIEEQLGKRAVPDGMLSRAEYRRWLKVDPAAVQDYVKGTKSYTPRTGSDGYFAALIGRPVPGSRAAKNLSTRSEGGATKPPRKRRRPSRSGAA